MKIDFKSKQVRSLLGIAIALLLFIFSNIKIPVIDNAADKYFSESITKAGVAYATCRVVNASVSVIKESDLSLEPAGVGVTLALGQALDPLDDMTERLSNVLVTAITALGVQKLAYEMGCSLAFPIIAFILILISALVWFENENVKKITNYAFKIIMIILIARFCLPISSMINEFLHTHFFEEQIALANEDLSGVTEELNKLKDVSLPEQNGIVGTINNSAAFLKQKTVELKNVIAVAFNNMGDIVETLLKLTFLYVSVFIFQVIILPVVIFLGLIKGANKLFEAA